MLEKRAVSDTEVVRSWLTAALGDKDSAVGRRAELARHCGVSSQAVSGWLRTGRITKQHLAKADEFFKHAPTFTTTPLEVRQPPGPYAHTAPPSAPPSDFHETRAPSNSEWQVLRDLEVYPEEERKKVMAELHAQAERWRAIEHELTARAKAKARSTP